MFGYVRAYPYEMKVCEYDYYRAAYCGLCRSNGKCTGCASRFMLNYDFIFISLVRSALTCQTAEFEMKRCIVHPFKKRLSQKSCEALNFSSYAAAILNYHKCRDDIYDEKGLKRLAAYLLLPILAGMRKKAAKTLPGLDESIKNELDILRGLEKEKCPSVDEPAAAFGRLTSHILSYGLENEKKKAAEHIGFHLGKWIYIADAFDDCEKDRKKGKYNPLSLRYPKKISDDAAAGIRSAMKSELMDAELGFDLLDYEDKRLKGIIDNIIYCGMPRRAEEIPVKKKNQKGMTDK